MRGRLGSLLYVVGNTRPLEAYAVSHLAAYVTTATVLHAKLVNKVIAQAKSTKHLHIHYGAGSTCDLVYTFEDSNFKAERDQGSQMGMVQFCGPCPAEDHAVRGASILRWNSTRARRVCHSTLAAETLSASAGLDLHCGLIMRLQEFDFSPEGVILTDCRSLFEHIYSMTGKSSERLMPDFAEIREACMPWRHAYSESYDSQFCELWWVDTRLQLADNFTKLVTPSLQAFQDALLTNTFFLGTKGTKTYLRPRVSQRALRSFWAMEKLFFSWLSCERNLSEAQKGFFVESDSY